MKNYIIGYPRSGNNWVHNRMTLFYNKCLCLPLDHSEVAKIGGFTHFGYEPNLLPANLLPHLIEELREDDKISILLRNGSAIVNSYFFYMTRLVLPKEPYLEVPTDLDSFVKSGWGISRFCRFLNEIQKIKNKVQKILFFYFEEMFSIDFIKNLPLMVGIDYSFKKDEIDYLYRNTNMTLLKQGIIDEEISPFLKGRLLRLSPSDKETFRDGRLHNYKETLSPRLEQYINDYLQLHCQLPEYRFQYLEKETKDFS